MPFPGRIASYALALRLISCQSIQAIPLHKAVNAES